MYTKDISQTVFNTKSLEHKKMSTRHFTMGMKCTTHLRTSVILKNEIQSKEHVYQASYYHNQQNPFNQTQQNDPNPYLNTHITKLNNNSKIQEIKAIIMKYLEKIRKPIPFLED